MTKASNNWKSDFKKILVEKKFSKECQNVKKISVGEGGVTYICQPWEGIIIWANSVHMDYIDYPNYDEKNWRYLALNICNEGRCEVSLQGDRYIYMMPGYICMSATAPREGFIYPGEFYEGIEMAFDLDILADKFPLELSAYGISMASIKSFLKDNDKSFMGTVSENVLSKSKSLFEYLLAGNLPISAYRFYTMELLYLIINGNTEEMTGKSYVTKGQRRIAVETEKIVTQNLATRYTVEELAGRFQVSSSALKKYFEAVYGMPISHYLREKRMRNAKELLASSNKNIGEIAILSGYENQGKFGAAFKAYTGETPIEYRRINKLFINGKENV